MLYRNQPVEIVLFFKCENAKYGSKRKKLEKDRRKARKCTVKKKKSRKRTAGKPESVRFKTEKVRKGRQESHKVYG